MTHHSVNITKSKDTDSISVSLESTGQDIEGKSKAIKSLELIKSNRTLTWVKQLSFREDITIFF